jgi:hypothetical protein
MIVLASARHFQFPHPRHAAEGASHNRLAAAVLAGARVAAAATVGASALAIPLRFDVLAIVHFSLLFHVAPFERITI